MATQLQSMPLGRLAALLLASVEQGMHAHQCGVGVPATTPSTDHQGCWVLSWSWPQFGAYLTSLCCRLRQSGLGAVNSFHSVQQVEQCRNSRVLPHRFNPSGPIPLQSCNGRTAVAYVAAMRIIPSHTDACTHGAWGTPWGMLSLRLSRHTPQNITDMQPHLLDQSTLTKRMLRTAACSIQ